MPTGAPSNGPSRHASIRGPLRCAACGNKTRFDVVEVKRVRSFQHFTLGGEVTTEEEEVLDRSIEQVTCRWCGASGSVVEGSPRIEA